MTPIGSTRNTILLFLLALVLLAPAASNPEPQDPLTIYHVFATAGQSAEWTSVLVPDDPAAWHVGRPDGPVANRSQLDEVRASLHWVVVGTTCPSSVAQSVHYPCAFELAPPVHPMDSGALRVDRPWGSTSGDLLTQYEHSAPTSITAFSHATGSAHARRPSIMSTLAVAESFVGVYTEDAFSYRAASALSFRFRTHTNPISHPRVGVSQGLMILSTEATTDTAARNRAAGRPGTTV